MRKIIEFLFYYSFNHNSSIDDPKWLAIIGGLKLLLAYSMGLLLLLAILFKELIYDSSLFFPISFLTVSIFYVYYFSKNDYYLDVVNRFTEQFKDKSRKYPGFIEFVCFSTIIIVYLLCLIFIFPLFK